MSAESARAPVSDDLILREKRVSETVYHSGPGFNFSGSEDCLFLSVYAPQNKANLPVLVWIRKPALFIVGILK